MSTRTHSPLTGEATALTPDNTSWLIHLSERAAEARHGGRYLTKVLNGFSRRIERGDLGTHLGEMIFTERRPLGHGLPPAEAVTTIWKYNLSPAGSSGSGRDTTAEYARDLAAGEYVLATGAKPVERRLSLAEAEEMASWPILRAAVEAPLRNAVHGALQTAYEASEEVLADPAARGRFREGMGIAGSIYRREIANGLREEVR